jgi:hypothetical protein
MNLVKPKQKLPMLVGVRRPSLLERLLFGITCIGFCSDPTNQEQLTHCQQLCGTKLFEQLGCATTHRMLPGNEKK